MRDEAIGYMKKIVELNSTSCDLNAWLGKMMTEQEHYYESIPYWNAASFKHNCSGTYIVCLDSLLLSYGHALPDHPELETEYKKARARGDSVVAELQLQQYLQEQQQQQQQHHHKNAHHKQKHVPKKN